MQWMRLVVMLGVLGVGLLTGGAPTKMTHLKVQMRGADIPADSFAAKPKIYWRASNQYCRADEEPDPENGIHGRMIVNEPDAWLINLADNTAKHFVDKGPTFNCRLPVFAFDPESAKGKIGGLEFGREVEFFHANGAKAIEGPKVEPKANFYELTIGDSVLHLAEQADNHAPLLVNLTRGGKVVEVRYLLWDDQEPFKEQIFAKPVGVKIEEVQ